MTALRQALALVALILLARVAFGVLFAHADGEPALRAMIRADLARFGDTLGPRAELRALRWAARVRDVPFPFPFAGSGKGGVAPGLEPDLFARVEAGTRGMRRLVSLNVQMGAARAAALVSSWPLAALAIVAGLSNGITTRHARRHRLAPESAFLFRTALAALWLPVAAVSAYVAIPVAADPAMVAVASWTVTGVAAFLCTAFFKKRL